MEACLLPLVPLAPLSSPSLAPLSLSSDALSLGPSRHSVGAGLTCGMAEAHAPLEPHDARGAKSSLRLRSVFAHPTARSIVPIGGDALSVVRVPAAPEAGDASILRIPAALLARRAVAFKQSTLAARPHISLFCHAHTDLDGRRLVAVRFIVVHVLSSPPAKVVRPAVEGPRPLITVTCADLAPRVFQLVVDILWRANICIRIANEAS